MTRPPLDLGDVWVFQTPLWQTNTLLAEASGEVLLCDPCWTPEELAAIADVADEMGGTRHVLITHADYDHTCGIGAFPDATVVAGPETAAAVASGTVAESLEAASAEWGLAWRGDPRVDRVVGPGVEIAHSAFRVATIDTRGHAADGLGFVILDKGVLAPGDYLSSMTYPFVADSLVEIRRSSERLLSALDEHDLRLVVPGHGDAHSPAEARAIGEDDIAYLERLDVAAREARDAALSEGDALLAVYAVEPPRPTTDDFEVFGLRAFNARQALAQTGGRA